LCPAPVRTAVVHEAVGDDRGVVVGVEADKLRFRSYSIGKHIVVAILGIEVPSIVVIRFDVRIKPGLAII
jgi:hypothetical protein